MDGILSTFPPIVPDIGDPDVTPGDKASSPYMPRLAATARITNAAKVLAPSGPAAFEKYVRAGGGGANLAWQTLMPGLSMPVQAQQLLAKLELLAGYDVSTVAASVERFSPGDRHKFIQAMSNPGIPLGAGTSLSLDATKMILASTDQAAIDAAWDYLWVAELVYEGDTRSSLQKALDSIGAPFVAWGNKLVAKNTTGGTWYTNSSGQTVEVGGNTSGWGVLGGEVTEGYKTVTAVLSGNIAGLGGVAADFGSSGGPGSTNTSSAPPPVPPAPPKGIPRAAWIAGGVVGAAGLVLLGVALLRR